MRELPIVKDAYLGGSRRLAGDVMEDQFIAEAAAGRFTDFPMDGSAAMMMAGDPLMNGGRPGAKTAKLNSEKHNVFRGVFNGLWFALLTVPPGPRGMTWQS